MNLHQHEPLSMTHHESSARSPLADGTHQVCTHLPTPVGTLLVVATDNGVAAILWENDSPTRVRLNGPQDAPGHPVLTETGRQLAQYFAGERTSFDLPLDVAGTTFQREVWAALRTIPFGETRSYVDIARQIGRPAAARAVGAANGRNPLSIVTPCHRVIGAAGALTGFAGGLDIKARLLAFERTSAMGPRLFPDEPGA